MLLSIKRRFPGTRHLRFRVWGLGSRVLGSRFWAFGVLGSGFWVYSLGCRPPAWNPEPSGSKFQSFGFIGLRRMRMVDQKLASLYELGFRVYDLG